MAAYKVVLATAYRSFKGFMKIVNVLENQKCTLMNLARPFWPDLQDAMERRYKRKLGINTSEKKIAMLESTSNKRRFEVLYKNGKDL